VNLSVSGGDGVIFHRILLDRGIGGFAQGRRF
jgi:hypothetical protein